MDFVILGFGIGALAVLVGLGMRDLGPMLRRVPRGDRGDLQWSEVARRIGWGRTCRAAGLVVTLSGAALCLLTLLVLIAGAGDGFGMGAVLGALALALVVGGVWVALFVRQAIPGQAGMGRESGFMGDGRRRPVGGRVVTERREIAPRTGSAPRSGGAGAGRRRTVAPPSAAGPDLRPRAARSRSGSAPAEARSDRVDPRSAVVPPPADDPEAAPAEAAPRRVERGR